MESVFDRAAADRDIAANRHSDAAWKEFCDGLSPGLAMDLAVHYVVRIEPGALPWPYSTDLGVVVAFATTWCTSVLIADADDDSESDLLFRCELEEALEQPGQQSFTGTGTGETVAEAVCRALLAMFSPNEDELASGNGA